ncbi:LysM peptidoglycan-binding domain-containing protein [Bdellovibrionota bacterium FG-1]
MSVSQRIRSTGFLIFLFGLAAMAYEPTSHLANAQVPHLKSISDEEWKTIAGAHLSEKYQIVKGDTLYDVSKRLFGDPNYWPKLYALNNATISNPHLILPGNSISFQPGTGTSLPAVLIASNTATDTSSGLSTASDSVPIPSKPPRSEEWKQLPKQAWESVTMILPLTADRKGIDASSRVRFKQNNGFEPESLASSERIFPKGQIVGSRSRGIYMNIGDTVYARADDDLQVGETYAVSEEPSTLKSRNSDRVGSAYPILGKVKIIGVRDELFIGTVLSARGLISRGSNLIPLPARVPDLSPIPAPNAVAGVLMVDKTFSTSTTAQHKLVFVDRGSDEGVKPGMVFRAYTHQDPVTDKKITSSNFIVEADLIVVQVSERFCAAEVLRSIATIEEGAPVILLTDVSDLLSTKSSREKLITPGSSNKKDDELDELDQMDTGTDLGKDEQKELEQLERWKANPQDAAPAAPPTEAAPGVPETAPPSPPAADLPPSTQPEGAAAPLNEAIPPSPPDTGTHPTPGGELPSPPESLVPQPEPTTQN